MIDKTDIYGLLAESMIDSYAGVYCVNSETGEFRCFSSDPGFNSLHIDREGTDFYSSLSRDGERVVIREDLHFFTEDVLRERVEKYVKSGELPHICFRLNIGGKPVYHTLRMIRKISDDSEYFLIGVLNVDREVRYTQEADKIRNEREIYSHIAESLAGNYDTLYYVDTESGKYFEFTAAESYKALHVPVMGQDFFAETRENVVRYVCPEDREFAEGWYYRENMMAALSSKRSFSYRYRLQIGNEKVYYRFTVIQAEDEKHIIVCVKNIADEVAAEQEKLDTRMKNITYNQIAESLASNYDVIYYIDLLNNSYSQYISNPIYGSLEIKDEGSSFFEESKANARKIIHPHDIDRLLDALEKDHLITQLENKKQYSIEYRMVIDGHQQYTRLTAMWSSDRMHMIIGVENVDEEVRRETEQLHALDEANEMARRDSLTGIKNKTAYTELERSVQNNIENGIDYLPFALVVCDLNDLKLVNDSEGHRAGDDYICSASKLICETFAHSPVFRIGGDEFAVFIRGGDYPRRDELFTKLHEDVEKNLASGSGPVIAAGMAVYDRETDKSMSDVFERADNMMYTDKRRLKETATA